MSALPHPRFTEELQVAFLARLRHHGGLATAAEQTGIPLAAVRRARTANPDFDDACQDALLLAAERIELEAVRRAVEGYEEPVFHQGEEVGARTRYSDPLTLRLLEGRLPLKYNPRVQHTHSHEHTGGVLLIPSSADPEAWAQQALEALPQVALPAPEDPETIEAEYTATTPEEARAAALALFDPPEDPTE